MISEALITAAVVGVGTLVASLAPDRKKRAPVFEIVGGDLVDSRPRDVRIDKPGVLSLMKPALRPATKTPRRRVRDVPEDRHV